VVGRLAQQNGLVVRLRSTVAGEANSGTTAGVYVPSELIVRAGMRDEIDTGAQSAPVDAHSGIAPALTFTGADDFADSADYGDEVGVDQLNGHPEVPVSLLPQRSPGASGIHGSSATLDEEPTQEPKHWDIPVAEESRQAPADTSAFFASRAQASTNGTHLPRTDAESDGLEIAAQEVSETAGADDAIYQKMVSEWLVDPTQLAKSSDLNWESVWDHGWSAAEAAEDAPVASHTEQGLPVRDPGARLVPGTAMPRPHEGTNGGYSNGGAHRSHGDDDRVESAAEFTTGAHAIPVRDPDAVRASMSSHFGGVHAARSHARETRGTDNE